VNNLDFAIAMELNGEKYYIGQAERNKDNLLKLVFEMLADDEARHARILQNKFSGTAYALAESGTLTKAGDLFIRLGNFHNKDKNIPDQLDVYNAAREMEKQSISLYAERLSNAADDEERALFRYLVSQEQDHFAILDELFTMINRPNNWTEAAEFGLREEY
jgi:rubrerythrin